ncbi:UNVERIFIED_CONTAM: NifU-like protein 2, chloroplastic [Sesamum latifolium]|uniref:NifU-like protein 2, chloroplastic n=1 Tax=Sesamum latifolium TaxID=2727402 RepID=A0AAW2V0V2_9LAMI
MAAISNHSRLRQTFEPSCSPSSSSAAALFRRLRPPRSVNLVASSFRFGIGSPSGSRRQGIKAVATSDSALELPLTAENVESVLDEVRPYLIADGEMLHYMRSMGML